MDYFVICCEPILLKVFFFFIINLSITFANKIKADTAKIFLGKIIVEGALIITGFSNYILFYKKSK